VLGSIVLIAFADVWSSSRFVEHWETLRDALEKLESELGPSNDW
jgi:hypothetical protein